jgi:phosphatidylserine decarboxylase
MAVCVGAMMVGSIKTTVEQGDAVKKGQEFGYFAFGKSGIYTRGMTINDCLKAVRRLFYFSKRVS